MNDEFVISQEELEEGGREGRRGRSASRDGNREHWKRAFKWLAITVLLAVIGVIAFVYFNLSKISVNPFGFGHLKGEDRGRVNIMMLGVGDPGHDGEKLSDTNILLSVDTVNHKVALISIPRDTRVDIPGYGESKINNANAKGGIKTAKRVFEDTLGQPVDYYVKANFTGLKEVVDAVGGIDVNNTDMLYDPEYPCDNNQYRSCGFKLKPGHYHLDGATALKYVRCRKGTCGNDTGRAARQQEVMQAIREKATSAGTLANPIALGKLVSAAGNNIETDLSINNMLRLNELTKQAGKNNIYNIVLGYSNENDFLQLDPQGTSDIVPKAGDDDFSDIQAFVQDIFTIGPTWMENASVVIENGTTTSGLGANFSTKLRNDGRYLTISGVTNAVSSDYATSQIIDYTGGKKPHTVAYLKKALGIQQATPPPTTNGVADIVVILGDDYAASHSTSSGNSSQNDLQ